MIKTLHKRLPEDVRHILTLMVGNGLALALPVLISPVLTRIYGVDDFAFYTVFTALVGYISAFASGRYEYAILIAKSRNAASHLFKISILILAVISLLTAVLIVLFHDNVQQLFGVSGMGWLIYLVPVNIVLFTLIRISGNGLNREKDYASISKGKTIKAIFSGAGQLLIGYTGVIGGGLILGKVIGDVFSAAYVTNRVERAFNYISEKFSLSFSKELAVKHRRYPQINSFHAFLNASSNNAIPLIIGALFDQQVVGWFGLSFMVCMAPIQLLGTAVYQVFSQKVSVKFNDGEILYGYTAKTVKTLAYIAAVPFLLLGLFGPDLFDLIFGETWIPAGEYAQILAPYLFVTFLLSPLTYLPLIFNEHKKALYFEFFSTLFKIASVFAGAYLGSIYTALYLFSGTGIVIHLATLIWILRLSRNANS